MKTIYKIHDVLDGNLILRTESMEEAYARFNGLGEGYELSVCRESDGRSLGSTLLEFK